MNISELKGEVDPDRINTYVCDTCKHLTKTIDVDKGVTPFMHDCVKCGDTAKSTFYNNIEPRLKPVQEWYRPTLEECLKLRKNEPLLEHVFQGGLLNRNL